MNFMEWCFHQTGKIRLKIAKMAFYGILWTYNASQYIFFTFWYLKQPIFSQTEDSDHVVFCKKNFFSVWTVFQCSLTLKIPQQTKFELDKMMFSLRWQNVVRNGKNGIWWQKHIFFTCSVSQCLFHLKIPLQPTF